MRPASIFMIVIGLVISSSKGFAQDRVPDYPAEIGREDWQARVKALQARAEAMRREHRSVGVQQPTVEEIAQGNSRRILEDDSLLPGDIISTDKGLFQFRGSPDGNKKPDDFVRIR